MEVISEKPISMSQLKDSVEKIKKRDNELNFRVKKLEDYLNALLYLQPAKAAELASNIRKLNVPRLSDKHIHKIVDIMPKKVDDLKLILQAYTITVSKENHKKIIETVKESAKK